MYVQQLLGAMAETNKLPINRHYPLPSNSSLVLLEVAMCWTNKNLHLPNSLVSRNNTDMIEEVYNKCHLWVSVKVSGKRTVIWYALLVFPHFLSLIFFQCGTVSRAIFWPWEWESHIKDDGTKKNTRKSGSPMISWAITPSLDCQPLEFSLFNKNKQTPNLFKPLFSELFIYCSS